MPPRQRITKEILLDHAFQIAENKGISAVTSRSVAKSVGCSIENYINKLEFQSRYIALQNGMRRNISCHS